MFKQKIETLREMLMSSDDFSEVFDYFFTYMAEDPRFLDKSKKAKNKFVRHQLEIIGEEAFKTDSVQISYFFLHRFQKTKFLHGSFFLNGNIGAVFYFEDIHIGMFSLSLGGGTSFFRISSQQVGGKPGADFDESDVERIEKLHMPPHSKSVH